MHHWCDDTTGNTKHTCTYKHMHTQLHTHTMHVYMQVWDIHIHTCVYTYMYTHMRVYMQYVMYIHTCMYMYMYIHTSMRTHKSETHMCTHTHMCTCTHTIHVEKSPYLAPTNLICCRCYGVGTIICRLNYRRWRLRWLVSRLTRERILVWWYERKRRRVLRVVAKPPSRPGIVSLPSTLHTVLVFSQKTCWVDCARCQIKFVIVDNPRFTISATFCKKPWNRCNLQEWKNSTCIQNFRCIFKSLEQKYWENSTLKHSSQTSGKAYVRKRRNTQCLIARRATIFLVRSNCFL